jgi:hypothetical protein
VHVLKSTGLKICGLIVAAVAVLSCATDRRSAAENTRLSAAEARILIYISPAGDALRANGSDIGLEQQTGAQLNQADYYYFWVYNAKRQQPGGSVTIGYYAVNKHTADVWDTDPAKIDFGRPHVRSTADSSGIAPH